MTCRIHLGQVQADEMVAGLPQRPPLSGIPCRCWLKGFIHALIELSTHRCRCYSRCFYPAAEQCSPISRSPIHGSSPGYLAGSGGRSTSHAKGAASVSTYGNGGGNNSSRAAHHRGASGASGGGGGSEASTSRYRPRTNSSFGSIAVGDGVTGSRTTASVPAGGQKREGGNRKSTSNGGSSNSSSSSTSNKAGDSCNTSGKNANNGSAGAGAGAGEGDDIKNGAGRASAAGGSRRPWTARQGQRQQHPLSPRLTGSGSGCGSGSGSGGSEPGNDGVGRGGDGGGGGRETGRAAATVATSEGGGDVVKIHVCDESRGITRGGCLFWVLPSSRGCRVVGGDVLIVPSGTQVHRLVFRRFTALNRRTFLTLFL